MVCAGASAAGAGAAAERTRSCAAPTTARTRRCAASTCTTACGGRAGPSRWPAAASARARPPRSAPALWLGTKTRPRTTTRAYVCRFTAKRGGRLRRLLNVEWWSQEWWSADAAAQNEVWAAPEPRRAGKDADRSSCALERLADRLLDWFSVLMDDAGARPPPRDGNGPTCQ